MSGDKYSTFASLGVPAKPGYLERIRISLDLTVCFDVRKNRSCLERETNFEEIILKIVLSEDGRRSIYSSCCNFHFRIKNFKDGLHLVE